MILVIDMVYVNIITNPDMGKAIVYNSLILVLQDVDVNIW
jgi:hypothetical protein